VFQETITCKNQVSFYQASMVLGVFKLGIFDGHFDRENMGTHGFSP
jgi:hypothetical protein